MGFLQRLKARLRTEAADLSESTKKLEAQLETDLSKRERQLNETPTDGLERLQREIDDSASSFTAISDKIGHISAKAEAVTELVDDDGSGDSSEDL